MSARASRALPIRERGRATLLLGLGNLYRGDDAVGPLVVRSCRRALAGPATSAGRLVFEEFTGDGTALLDSWRGFRRVFLFDAVASGSPTGTIHRLDARDPRVCSLFFHGSTHSIGVADAIELARVLGTLPSDLVIYGVEGSCFHGLCALSEKVESAVELVVERVRADLVGAALIGAVAG